MTVIPGMVVNSSSCVPIIPSPLSMINWSPKISGRFLILTENAALDEDALKRAEQNGVIILTTAKNSYQVAAEISRLI